jgi:hypothetical protein
MVRREREQNGGEWREARGERIVNERGCQPAMATQDEQIGGARITDWKAGLDVLAKTILQNEIKKSREFLSKVAVSAKIL